jgi:predicted ATP-dependent endonuclease of OLD family
MGTEAKNKSSGFYQSGTGRTMKLEKVVIEGFRSIRDRAELIVDGEVTVLIGANDHGKSNLLSAILALNPDRPFTEEDRNWDTEDANSPSIEWHFRLSEAEVEKVSAIQQAAPNVSPEQPETPPKHTPRIPDFVVFFRSEKHDVLVLKTEDDPFTDEQAAALLKMRPRVELFGVSAKIADQVQLTQLDTPQFEFMKGLFLKAGLWEDRAAVFTQTPKTERMLDAASTRLTQVLRAEWEQGKNLRWKFSHASAGNAIQLLIEDPAVSKTYVRPSQRSSGFTSFFVLSLTLFARTASQAQQSFIYLFDEPGVDLHPIAQINLQRVFESLAERAQIVYTTHSIFMVSKNAPARNRVVKKTQEGTIIDKKPYAGNWKAVRDSLGIFLSHNFMISDRTLLVEGPSDAIYILAALSYLSRWNKLDLDLNAFSIVDAGNKRNYVAMAKLMLDEERKVFALLDNDAHGAAVKKELEKVTPQHMREKSLVIHLLPNEASIEDILPHPDILAEAAFESVEWLVARGVLKLADNLSLDEVKARIKQVVDKNPKGRTLGTALEDVIKDCLQDKKECVSKLTIAAAYDDKLKSAGPDSKTAAKMLQLAENIQNELLIAKRRAERNVLQPDV